MICVYLVIWTIQCCSVLQRVAACCSVLQCVAACCSVLQCVAVYCSVCSLMFAYLMFEPFLPHAGYKVCVISRKSALSSFDIVNWEWCAHFWNVFPCCISYLRPDIRWLLALRVHATSFLRESSKVRVSEKDFWGGKKNERATELRAKKFSKDSAPVNLLYVKCDFSFVWIVESPRERKTFEKEKERVSERFSGGNISQKTARHSMFTVGSLKLYVSFANERY